MKNPLNPFDQVSHMNSAFGNPKGVMAQPDWEALGRQYKILESEFKELGLALDRRQMHGPGGVRDGVADVNVVNLGVAHIAGIDSDTDMLEVFESNMSKMCTNAEELQATVVKYNNLGLEVVTYPNYPLAYVKSAKDQTGNDGEFYKQGKFLKGINFQEPKLEAPNV